MKADGISKAMEHAQGRGMADTALESIPEGGMPTDLPVAPETEAMGPPDVTPPVETGDVLEFDELTGLPLFAMDNVPNGFPAEAESDGEADDVLDFLF